MDEARQSWSQSRPSTNQYSQEVIGISLHHIRSRCYSLIMYPHAKFQKVNQSKCDSMFCRFNATFFKVVQGTSVLKIVELQRSDVGPSLCFMPSDNRVCLSPVFSVGE